MLNRADLTPAKATQAVIALALCFSAPAMPDIYKCEVAGKVEFSDVPCGDSAVSVEVEDSRLGGRLDTGAGSWEPAPAPEKKRPEADPCPYINSSEMRALNIRRTIKVGMRPSNVRASWGDPSSVNRHSAFVQWAYHYPTGTSQYVYFNEAGCVYSFGQQDTNY